MNPLRNMWRNLIAMALDQSALIDVLEALRAADVDDRIRQAAQTIYQALIEAELTAVLGAAPNERTETRDRQAQRPPAQDADHHSRRSGAAHPQAAGRVVLPVAVGTPPPRGSGPVRRGHVGLSRRCLHQESR
jgi:hypothetical protein